MLCIFHDDLDGECSAAIVKRAKIMVDFFRTNYNRALPPDSLLKDQNIIIVDFSYKPDEMSHIIEVANSVVWIDHHITAANYPYQFLPGLRNFEDKAQAGCELTWEYFFKTVPVPWVVRFIGDYDKWALKLVDSKVFCEGMKMLNTHPEDRIWETLWMDIPRDISTIISSGKIAAKYKESYCINLCESYGYKTLIEGVEAYVCNQYMFGSDGFVHRFKEYPVCIAYIHDGDRFIVSLYSESIDVSKIAKVYGGGGHKGAAGFVCSTLPFERIL